MTEKPHEILYHWTARKIQPVILIYVGLIFIIFIAFSYFVFHSGKAVKALLYTSLGVIVPLLPGVLSKIKYRLTKTSLEKWMPDKKGSGNWKEVFQMQNLDYIVPLKFGFKYYLKMEEQNPVRRFGKKYISDKFSGEVHTEPEDKRAILKELQKFL